MWSSDDLLSLIADALVERELELREEQAVHGLDSLSEVQLHPTIAAGLEATGFGVLREHLYPAQWKRARGKRRALPDDSQRQRCDVVITPRAGQVLVDELVIQREIASVRDAAAGTLFQPLVEGTPDAALNSPMLEKQKELVSPADAYWLEVKLVGQFCYTDGFAGPNRTYTSELTRGVPMDLRKLRDDPAIVRAGALLLHFAADEAIARHDLAQLIHRCVDRGLRVRPPSVRVVPIQDRIGNAVCGVSIIEPIHEPVEDEGSAVISESPSKQSPAGSVPRDHSGSRRGRRRRQRDEDQDD